METYTADEMNAAIARVETAKQNHPVGWGFLRELSLPEDLVPYAFTNAHNHLSRLAQETDKRLIYSVGWLNGVGIGIAMAEQRMRTVDEDEKSWVWKSPTRHMLHAQDCEWVQRQQTNRYVSFQKVTIEGDYFTLASDPTVRVGWRHLINARPVCRICGYQQNEIAS